MPLKTHVIGRDKHGPDDDKTLAIQWLNRPTPKKEVRVRTNGLLSRIYTQLCRDIYSTYGSGPCQDLAPAPGNMSSIYERPGNGPNIYVGIWLRVRNIEEDLATRGRFDNPRADKRDGTSKGERKSGEESTREEERWTICFSIQLNRLNLLVL
ncbi:hypothetical protein NPIL_345101 [Nephila pilipes]|uniref:Uncharacterized protein n=1 Tax=Nephila pilipes TaxID=299642 RepID=A0A8X6TI97_NEPPI|nr:hypothetical protein NPIL_345101 [Nephila pilipes]